MRRQSEELRELLTKFRAAVEVEHGATIQAHDLERIIYKLQTEKIEKLVRSVFETMGIAEMADLLKILTTEQASKAVQELTTQVPLKGSKVVKKKQA